MFFIVITSYYHANVDETRKKIEQLIEKDEWNSGELLDVKQILLDNLQIEPTIDKRLNDLQKEHSRLQKAFKQHLPNLQIDD